MEVSGQLQGLAVLPLAKTVVPIKQAVGGPQSRSGRFEEQKSLFPLPRIEFRIVQPIAWSLLPTALSRFIHTKTYHKNMVEDVDWLKLGQKRAR
jgi:hypothetical protein